MIIIIKDEAEEAYLTASLNDAVKYVSLKAGIIKAVLFKKRLLRKEKLITVKYCDEYSSIGGFGAGINVERKMMIEII